MRIVCDSSVSRPWCLPEETVSFSERMFLSAKAPGLTVPDVWHVEMANILGLKRRSGDLSVQLLAELNIETSFDVCPGSIEANLKRMRRFGLAACDAMHLELTGQRGCPLVTFDRAVVRAARQAGVETRTAE